MGAGAGCGAILPAGAFGAGVGSMMAIGSGATAEGAFVMAFFTGCGGGGEGGGAILGAGGSISSASMTTGTTNAPARANKPL